MNLAEKVYAQHLKVINSPCSISESEFTLIHNQLMVSTFGSASAMRYYLSAEDTARIWSWKLQMDYVKFCIKESSHLLGGLPF